MGFRYNHLSKNVSAVANLLDLQLCFTCLSIHWSVLLSICNTIFSGFAHCFFLFFMKLEFDKHMV